MLQIALTEGYDCHKIVITVCYETEYRGRKPHGTFDLDIVLREQYIMRGTFYGKTAGKTFGSVREKTYRKSAAQKLSAKTAAAEAKFFISSAAAICAETSQWFRAEDFRAKTPRSEQSLRIQE